METTSESPPAPSSATVSAPARPPGGAPPSLPRLAQHVVAGVSAGLVMTIADAVRAALDDTAPRVDPGEFALAVFHLLAIYLPLGLLVALAFGALGLLAERTPLLRPFWERVRLRALVRRDPEGFAGGLGVLAGMAVLAFTSRWVFDVLVTRVHRMDLAAWAMGGIALAVVAAAVLAGALARAAVLPVARRIGPVASLGTLVLVFVAAVVTVAWLFLRPAWRDVSNAYGVAPVAWGPAGLLAYAVSLPVTRAIARWRRVSARRAWRAVLVTVLVTAALWVGSGLSYGRSNHVRSVVEQRSVIGLRMIRRYARITDLDGDGHPWAFGGRDCNDFDSSVHPGALDVEGDGVDADCFAGDGSPDVERLTDGEYGEWPGGFPTRPNIVLFTIDALRPDHLEAFGYERDTSPNIARFAEDAVRFEHAYAQSSRSIRSIPAMMTGRYPSQIAYGPEYLYPSLMAENQTLAELLKDRGYQTAVTMGTDYFHRTGGFFQGFDDVHEVLVYKPPRDRAVDHALRQLEELSRGNRPFFLWVHLFNVHLGYLDPPAPSRYGDELADKYDTEIRFADEQFQRMLDALAARGHDDDTIVVLASDHGEALEEHGQRGHSQTLYEEEVRSTLVIRAPRVAGRTVSCPVGLLDVAPTLLNAARIPMPAPTPARSLAPLMTGDAGCDDFRERYLFAELMPDGLFPYDVKSIRSGDEKLIWWVQDGRVQLFDLSRDPAEQTDLSDARPDRARELLGLLQAWVARSNRPENRTEAFVADHLLDAPPERMTHPLGLRYPGMFTVLGCDLPQTEFHPGQTIELTCYYRVDAETDLDLFFRVMLEAPHGVRLPRDFHAMHFPLHGRYRTHQWRAGQIISDPMPMVVPPELQTPLDLRLTFAVHVRGQGLQGFSQAGRTAHAATLDTIRIRPAPTARTMPPAPTPRVGTPAIRVEAVEAPAN